MQTNWKTLVVAVLGAAKLILDAAGYEFITDEHINNIATGIAAVVTVIGVFMSHKKEVKTNANSEFKTPIDPTA